MEAAGKRYVQHPSRSDVFTLWGIGDVHFGAPGCDIKRLRRDIGLVAADPFALWVGLGDMADYIAPGDKRFSAEHLDDKAKLNIGRLGQYYMECVKDLFYPIRDKCLGMLFGNHEEKYFLHNNRDDGHSWLCQEMGVVNLKYCALFDLVFVRRKCSGPKLLLEAPPHKCGKQVSFRIYTHHGSGGGQTPGGKLNSLIGHMRNHEADLILTGHLHDNKAQRIVTIGADATCSKLVHKEKVGVICGSYLQTYNQGSVGYGEMKGYQPTSLGAALVQIVPDKREIRAEV